MPTSLLPTSTTTLVESFLDAKIAAGLSPRTIEAYRSRLGKFRDWIGDRDITRSTVRGYLAFLQQQPLTPSSKASYFRDVSILCAWLVDEGDLATNPAAKLAPKVPKHRPHSYKPAQIAQLLAACDERHRAMIIVLLDTGLRASELVSIRLDAIDWDAGAFTVLGKGGKERQCWLSDYTLAVLRDYLAMRRDTSPWLWPNRYGEPITRSGLYQAIRRAAVRAGIRDDVRRLVHSMRVVFAVSYVKQGGDLESLRRLLGHASITMAAHYAQLADDELGDQKRRVNPLGRIIAAAAD